MASRHSWTRRSRPPPPHDALRQTKFAEVDRCFREVRADIASAVGTWKSARGHLNLLLEKFDHEFAKRDEATRRVA